MEGKKTKLLIERHLAFEKKIVEKFFIKYFLPVRGKYLLKRAMLKSCVFCVLLHGTKTLRKALDGSTH